MNKNKYIQKLKKFEQGLNPGVALLMVENGEVSFKSCFGYADLKRQIKITSQSNFRLASVSKQFTGMALAMLEQSNELDTEKYIVEYLPNLPSYCGQITVEHLIRHMSGMPDYYEDLCVANRSEIPLSNANVVEFLHTKTELEFKQGTQYQYSNTGYNILGTLIGKITGKSYGQYMEEYIFKKANMNSSSVITFPEPDISNRVFGYSAWPMFDLNDYNSGNYLLGEDGIYTSLDDFLEWIMAIENNALVSHDMQNKIFSPGLTSENDPVKYGYGWKIVEYRGHKAFVHGGSWVGFRNMVAYFPDKKLWVVGLSNCGGISSWDTIKPLIHHQLGINN